MSGIFKAIGRAFKAVVNVVKKIALPVLAIGAVVLTGGAALGALPSVGGLASSLGLSPALTGVLTTAAKGATMGAITSGVTGGNIVKGAASGFAIGGALGAAGTMMNRGVSAASQAANITAADPNSVNSIISSSSPMQGALADTVAPNIAGGGGIGSGIASSIVGNPTGGGGILGWMERNPLMAGSLVQGIGGGIMSAEQAKAARQLDQQARDSYASYAGLGPMASVASPSPIAVPHVAIDPATGRIIQKAN